MDKRLKNDQQFKMKFIPENEIIHSTPLGPPEKFGSQVDLTNSPPGLGNKSNMNLNKNNKNIKLNSTNIPNKYKNLELKMPLEKLLLFVPNIFMKIDNESVAGYELEFKDMGEEILDYMNTMFINIRNDLKRPQLGWGEVRSQFNSYTFRQAQVLIAFRVYYRLPPEMDMYSKVMHKEKNNKLYERIVRFHRLFMLTFISKKIIDKNGKRLKSFNNYLLEPRDKYKVQLGKIIKLSSNDVSEFIASYEKNEQPRSIKRKPNKGWEFLKNHEDKKRKLNGSNKPLSTKMNVVNQMDFDNKEKMEQYHKKFHKLATDQSLKSHREHIMNSNSNSKSNSDSNKPKKTIEIDTDIEMYENMNSQVGLILKAMKQQNSQQVLATNHTNKQLTNLLHRQKELYSFVESLQVQSDKVTAELEAQKSNLNAKNLVTNDNNIIHKKSEIPTPFPTPTSKHSKSHQTPIKNTSNDQKRGAEHFSREFLVNKSLNGFEVIDRELYEQSIKGNDGNELYAKLMNKSRRTNKDVVAELQGLCRVCTFIPIGVRVQYVLSQPSGLILR